MRSARNSFIARKLLELEPIKLSPSQAFTWASGWKSPIYCDKRLALSYPEVRRYITEQLVLQAQNSFKSTQGVAGVATAGIPQATLLAEQLELPLVYVRSKPKAHGMTNQVEGYLQAGQHLLVVEDLVSTGKSSLAAVKALRGAGAAVTGMLCIFTYGFPVADKAFEEENVILQALCDYDTLLAVAKETGYVQASDLDLLASWKQDPANWGQ